MGNPVVKGKAYLVSAVLIGMLLAGCGGGGGGDVAGSPAPPLPTLFTYQIRALDAGPLVASQGGSSVEVTDLNMNGTFDRFTEEVTLVNGGNPGPATTLVGTPFGTLPVSVSQQFHWVGDASPTAGEIVVERAPTDRIWLTVDSTIPGVRVRWDDNGSISGPVSFTWAQFDALLGSPAPEYQQIAAYAYGARGFLFEQAGLAVDALETITSRDDELAVGPVVFSCDPFPPGTGPSGTVTYTWIDASGNGDLGPGDRFTVAFDQCWIDDPADDIDTRLDGTMTLSGYTEVIGPPLFIGGEITFSGFVVSETEETSPGTFVPLPDPVTVGGGFSIYFIEQ